MKNLKTFLVIIPLLFLFVNVGWGQTNPTAQTLPYSQDFSTLSASSTTYPAGWGGWTISATPGASFNTATPTADKTLTASSTAATTSGNVHNYNGKIGFLNSSSLDLSNVFVINTTGLNTIQVSYDIMTIRNPYDGSSNTRINEVTLQYRVGTSGAFTNLTGIEYQNNTTLQTGAVTTPQNSQTKTITLPAACDNQAVVQLRWASRQVSGAGSRPSFAFDNISVTYAPTTQAHDILLSPSGTSTLVSWTPGDGAGRVVYVSNSATWTAPTNGTAPPSANKHYSGSGQQCIYSGNAKANSETVDQLTVGVTYYYRVYEYNGSGTSTNYLTTAGSFNNPTEGVQPVTLASLNSSITGRNVKINWTTAEELNNSGFEIERTEVSSKNTEFNKIAFVSGNGTKNTPTNYSYEDKNLNTGKYKYRLKQIDFNGNFEYFNLNGEIEIGVPKKYDLSQNYPNPFNPTTKINFDLPNDSKVELRIYDMLGREVTTLVNEVRTAGYYTVELNASTFSSGTYFYRLNAGDFSMVKKFVVLK